MPTSPSHWHALCESCANPTAQSLISSQEDGYLCPTAGARAGLWPSIPSQQIATALLTFFCFLVQPHPGRSCQSTATSHSPGLLEEDCFVPGVALLLGVFPVSTVSSVRDVRLPKRTSAATPKTAIARMAQMRLSPSEVRGKSQAHYIYLCQPTSVVSIKQQYLNTAFFQLCDLC